MCYRCEICREVMLHGSKRKVHRVMSRGQIKSEVPVCPSCDAGLRSGYTLERMREIVGPRMPKPVVTELRSSEQDMESIETGVV